MTQHRVRISGYGCYKGRNYGNNALRVDIGRLTFWFSYQTCVAFEVEGPGVGDNDLYVCRNCWGSTTGKHLNWIDDGYKEDRMERGDFACKLDAILEQFNLALPVLA